MPEAPIPEPEATPPEPSEPGPQAEPEPTPAAQPRLERPGWQARLRAWLKRALVRVAWALALFALGVVVGVIVWAEPLQSQVRQLRNENRALSNELAQTKADLGQAQGRITALERDLATAQNQAHAALQWAAYAQARAEIQAAYLALTDGQTTAARAHLALAQRALKRLAEQATDPALQSAADDLAAAVGHLLESEDTASAAARARRIDNEILPALEALEGLLPPQP